MALVSADQVPFATSAEFVGQQIEQTAQQCSGNVERAEAVRIDNTSVLQSVSCRSPGKTSHTFFLVRKTSSGFFVTAFSDFSEEGKSGGRLASQIQSVIQGTPIKEAWESVRSDYFGALGTPDFMHSPCAVVADGFASLDERPVAVRLQTEIKQDPNLYVFRIFQAKDTGLIDPWRMQLRNLSLAERDLLLTAVTQHNWLVYKVSDIGGSRQFQNQLFVINSAGACAPFRGRNTVEVAKMPNRIVQLYVEGLGIEAPEGNITRQREALASWAVGN